MTLSFRRRASFFALILGLSGVFGCAAEQASSDKGALPDVGAGKADGSLETVPMGEITFGEPVAATLEEGTIQEWELRLSSDAEVTLATTGGSIDTVLYLSGEAGPLDEDDDGGEGRLSSLQVNLGAGSYTVGVTLYPGTPGGDFSLVADCAGDGCVVTPADPYAPAWDVSQMHVTFAPDAPFPESYQRAEAGFVRHGGPEWWQRWPGGRTQSFGWSNGTAIGQRCAQASAHRLEAIWNYEEVSADGETTYPGQEAFEALRDGSGWGGGMFNWVEDISEGGRPAFSPAALWAWRTGTVKWVIIAYEDGSCDLPTLYLVQRFSTTCLEQAAREDGAIQGCAVRGR